MKTSLFSVEVLKKTYQGEIVLHMYTDGKNNLMEFRPIVLSNDSNLFLVGETAEIEGVVSEITYVKRLPKIRDEVISSIWEGDIAYCNKGFFGFLYTYKVKN